LEENARKEAENKEKRQIAEQKQQGMVTYGKFKGVRKENECISRYRLHFWNCKATNDKPCWTTLFKEFRNCLKVTVPDGKEYSAESTEILSKENDYAK
jgi:hypothetical protein